jgi:hypothetical protein
MMSQGSIENDLAGQLVRIARDPVLRGMVYERLGDYCHQCRNRLNSLKLMIYLMMKQAPAGSARGWEEINRHYRDLERRLDQIQTLCRPMTITRVTLGIDLLMDDRRQDWSRSMSARGRNLEFIPPTSRTSASFDADRLGQALDAIVDWRAGEGPAGRPARLRWWAEGDQAHVAWEEPDPNPTEVLRVPTHGGSLWALPLLVRVAEAHGGECRIEAKRGWRVEVSWPARSPTS